MKKLLLLSALLIFVCSYGQDEKTVPVYPGCKIKASNSENRKCMSSAISEFVVRKFDTDIAKYLGLSGRQRISVIFKIDKKGYVKDIRIRAPHPRLEKEAFRVINMLPRMTPGTVNDQPVIVPYSLPITFQVAPSEATK
jgi:protein TonB